MNEVITISVNVGIAKSVFQTLSSLQHKLCNCGNATAEKMLAELQGRVMINAITDADYPERQDWH